MFDNNTNKSAQIQAAIDAARDHALAYKGEEPQIAVFHRTLNRLLEPLKLDHSAAIAAAVAVAKTEFEASQSQQGQQV